MKILKIFFEINQSRKLGLDFKLQLVQNLVTGLNLKNVRRSVLGRVAAPQNGLGNGLQQHTIEAVSQEKDLGLTFDQNQTFRSHIESKTKGANPDSSLLQIS